MSCGSGLFSRRFAKSGRFAGVVASDFSENMLKQTAQFFRDDPTIDPRHAPPIREALPQIPRGLFVKASPYVPKGLVLMFKGLRRRVIPSDSPVGGLRLVRHVIMCRDSSAKACSVSLKEPTGVMQEHNTCVRV